MAGLLDLIGNSLLMKQARQRAKEQQTLAQLRINLNAYLHPENRQEQQDALANIDLLSGQMLGGQYKDEHHGIMHGLHSLGDAILGGFGMQLPQEKLPTTPGGLEGGATAPQGQLQPLVTSRVAGYDMGPLTKAGSGTQGGATPATLAGQTAPGYPPSTPGLKALQSIDPLGNAPGMTPRSAPSGAPSTQGLDALKTLNTLAGAPELAKTIAAQTTPQVARGGGPFYPLQPYDRGAATRLPGGGAPAAAGGIPITGATPASLANVPALKQLPDTSVGAPVDTTGAVTPLPYRAGAPPDTTGATTPMAAAPYVFDPSVGRGRGMTAPGRGLRALTQQGLTGGRLAELEAEGKLGGAQGKAIEDYMEAQAIGVQRGDITADQARSNISAVLNASASKATGTLGELAQAQQWAVNGTPEQKEAAKIYIDKFNRTGSSSGGTLGQINEAIYQRDHGTKEQQEGANIFLGQKELSTQTYQQKMDDAQDLADGVESGKIDPDLTNVPRDVKSRVSAILAKRGFNLNEASNDRYALRRYIAATDSAGQLRLRQALKFVPDTLNLLDNPQNPGDDYIGQLRNLVPRSQYPVLNKKAMDAAIHGLFGQKAADAATLLNNQIKDLQAELSYVYTGGNAPTDKALDTAASTLQSDWSDETLRVAVNQARVNLKLRLNSVYGALPTGMSQQGIEQYQRQGSIPTPGPEEPPSPVHVPGVAPGGKPEPTSVPSKLPAKAPPGYTRMQAPYPKYKTSDGKPQIFDAPDDKVDFYKSRGAKKAEQ